MNYPALKDRVSGALMKITIAQRDRPFSHLPGTGCLLPRSCWIVQAFPSKICLRDRERESADGYIEIPLNLHGPVREFTLLQDLERGEVLVWGIALEGRFRLRLQAVKGAIELWVEKSPAGGILCCGKTLNKNDHISWKNMGYFRENRVLERLSLGSHRALDWENVWRRLDFSEIFPVLFHLSHWIPYFSDTPPSAMQELIDQGFEPFLRAAFWGVLCPRLSDDQFQGFLENEKVHPQASPCSMIVDAGARIRSLFIQQKEREVTLLPCTDFSAGRMTGVLLDGIGSIDFEWTKGIVQRAILHASESGQLKVALSKPICSFRFRTQMHEKGRRKSIDDFLDLEAGKKYFLDRFQK